MSTDQTPEPPMSGSSGDEAAGRILAFLDGRRRYAEELNAHLAPGAGYYLGAEIMGTLTRRPTHPDEEDVPRAALREDDLRALLDERKQLLDRAKTAEESARILRKNIMRLQQERKDGVEESERLRQRAEQAEAEVGRLKARAAELGSDLCSCRCVSGQGGDGCGAPGCDCIGDCAEYVAEMDKALMDWAAADDVQFETAAKDQDVEQQRQDREGRATEATPLRWHYGPTDAEPNPGRMWCWGCRGEVFSEDGSYWCTGCGAEAGKEQA